ncbi:MAG: phosphate uptake regulator PhoU [Bacteroidetes bacterium]|nr:phosphate uptake regulator PhoU [Bacteroidota bacterium]
MNPKKELAIKKIVDDFESLSNLVLLQLNNLEKIIDDFSVENANLKEKTLEKNEAKLDQFEVKISEHIINAIVLYQPMASDLRSLFAIYRMTLNLERIGDMVINIIHYMQQINNPALFQKNSVLIKNMLIMSTNMVTKALLSFTNNDKSYAIWTIKNDEVIDELNHKLMKNAIKQDYLSDETRDLLLNFINLKGIISDIERIADHATNIAEASIYASEGTDIRHKGIENLDEL